MGKALLDLEYIGLGKKNIYRKRKTDIMDNIKRKRNEYEDCSM